MRKLKIGNESASQLNDTDLRIEFDSKHWVHKVDERVDHADLEECVHMIVTFYKERADSVMMNEEEENGLGKA